MDLQIQAKIISSLEKVFLDQELKTDDYKQASALRGERFSFQVAYCRRDSGDRISVFGRAESPLTSDIGVWEVGHVPVTFPVMPKHDNGYLRTTPGVYPDPLYPCNKNITLPQNQWRCLWITVCIPQDAPSGSYPVTVRLFDAENPECLLCEQTFTLKVIAATLPKQTLIRTEWFHVDCIADYYKVPVYSEEHWELIGNYMENAVYYGVNLLLTPVLTPPLDTIIGGERTSTQLVDIVKTDNGYSFGYDKLDRYMDMAEKYGIHRFEISHLFTQWGAKAAASVMAMFNGEYIKIFGWETKSTAKEYTAFLLSFLTGLKKHLASLGRLSRCYFHISDEPTEECLESYRAAKESVWGVLEDCQVIDALSEYTFYEQGLIRHPIPAVNHIDKFLERGYKNPWTYYCCGQGEEQVSNRLIAMPSSRNRILGWQMYRHNVEGFLHWGFNFWNSFLSRRNINPYIETGADDAFPAGDPYLVYPGDDGKPISSLRQIVFYEALQDMSALQLLETLKGRAAVLAVMDKNGIMPFKYFPQNPAELLNLRQEINDRIENEVER